MSIRMYNPRDAILKRITSPWYIENISSYPIITEKILNKAESMFKYPFRRQLKNKWLDVDNKEGLYDFLSELDTHIKSKTKLLERLPEDMKTNNSLRELKYWIKYTEAVHGKNNPELEAGLQFFYENLGKELHVYFPDSLHYDFSKEYDSPEWLYLDPEIYKFYPQSPPSETLKHVLRLEASWGCPHNVCTYCTEYQRTKFGHRTFDEFKKHLENVFEWMDKNHYNINGYNHGKLGRRVFLTGADALAIPNKDLSKMIEFTDYMINTERISLYGTTNSILSKTSEELAELNKSGKLLVYWGIETGNTELLNFVNKGCTHDNCIKAGEKLNSAGIEMSVMIMPGLGGRRFYNHHIEDTIKLLNSIKPAYLTFLSIREEPCSPYKTIMEAEVSRGENERLDEKSTLHQINDIVTGLDRFDCLAASYFGNVTPVASNPVAFRSKLDGSHRTFNINTNIRVRLNEIKERENAVTA